MARQVMDAARFGTESWLRGAMNVVGNSIQIGHADCSHLARLLPELRRYATERGLDWWRDLVEPRANGMPRAFVEHLERGVALLRATGRDGAITRDEAHAAAVAAQAQQATAIASHGEIGRGSNRVGVTTSNTTRRNDAAYLTARIARDRPDVLERMKRGEFRSVRAAAIEAGIIDPARQLEAQATRAVRRMTGDALDRLQAEIARRRAALDKPE